MCVIGSSISMCSWAHLSLCGLCRCHSQFRLDWTCRWRGDLCSIGPLRRVAEPAPFFPSVICCEACCCRVSAILAKRIVILLGFPHSLHFLDIALGCRLLDGVWLAVLDDCCSWRKPWYLPAVQNQVSEQPSCLAANHTPWKYIFYWYIFLRPVLSSPCTLSNNLFPTGLEIAQTDFQNLPSINFHGIRIKVCNLQLVWWTMNWAQSHSLITNQDWKIQF